MTLSNQIQTILTTLNTIDEPYLAATAQEIGHWFNQHHIEMVVIAHDPEKETTKEEKHDHNTKQLSFF